MFALLFLSTIAAAGLVGMAFDLVDNDPDVDAALDDLDEVGGFDLLEADLSDDALNDALSAAENGVVPIDADAVRDEYGPVGTVEIQGTEEDDIISAGADVEVTFAEDGNDAVFGGDHDQVIFGGAGDDALFAEDGSDQVFGDEGDDLMFGGGDDDLLVGDAGEDTIFGGAGNDMIFPSSLVEFTDASDVDVVGAGEGDDIVYVRAETALIELGVGEDDVLVHTDSFVEGNSPLAIITDFDPDEDQIVLGVYAPDFQFEGDANSLEISSTLTQIETAQGPATLVVPSVDDAELAEALTGANIGHAILIGVTPDQIETGNIRVLVESDTSNAFAPDSIQSVFRDQAAASRA